VPARKASELYCEFARSPASDSETCLRSSAVEGAAGLSGMLARSGVCALLSSDDWALSPADELSPIQLVGSTQSGTLEQALAPAATTITAARRANDFDQQPGFGVMEILRKLLRGYPANAPA
jgi:hypothetical protein